MLLAIDVGNTQTVIGIFADEELKTMWRIATNKADTADELGLKLRQLMFVHGYEPSAVKGCAIASVVPALANSWDTCIQQLFGVKPVACTAKSAGTLFKTTYANPTEIGSDRIADTVAAKSIYGAPVLVVDFGTATNIEVVDEDGFFVGGVIAPGLETSAKALFSHATKLPAIELADPGSVIGKDTIHAMRAGIVYGEADRVDGFVRRIFAELGYNAPVVATGGLAEVMAPLCETITELNPQLTLEGLRLIYEQSSLS